MSRIGRVPVAIPAGVTVTVNDQLVMAKGVKGELSYRHLPAVSVTLVDGTIVVSQVGDTRESRSLHGLTRTLIANLVTGVSVGFTKKLEIVGVGYKAAGGGAAIDFALGYSHPVKFAAPNGITLGIETEGKKTFVTVSGIDKAQVGEVAAKIRSLRPPEPYKGKGIRYTDEVVRRKAGKSGKAK